jgi:outer membrane biosynthesis protein TonB
MAKKPEPKVDPKKKPAVTSKAPQKKPVPTKKAPPVKAPAVKAEAKATTKKFKSLKMSELKVGKLSSRQIQAAYAIVTAAIYQNAKATTVIQIPGGKLKFRVGTQRDVRDMQTGKVIRKGGAAVLRVKYVPEKDVKNNRVTDQMIKAAVDRAEALAAKVTSAAVYNAPKQEDTFVALMYKLQKLYNSRAPQTKTKPAPVAKTEAKKPETAKKPEPAKAKKTEEVKPAKTETKPKADAKPKADVKPKTETKPKAEAKPKPVATPKPAAAAKPKPKVEPDEITEDEDLDKIADGDLDDLSNELGEDLGPEDDDATEGEDFPFDDNDEE